ncbi:MAG: adenylate kinase [Verrucomicrobia bacterium]|nr:adenylate kinase [Verrucomicrobiota bacterium]MCF7708262.1 adenylate kinase [Verrucomicrobiota bacterium]
MGKIIIVAGVPGAGKSSLLLEAWKRIQSDLKYTIVSFGTEMLRLCKEGGLVKDRDDMRSLSQDVQEEMQWRTTKRIAERPENILLDTHCAIKTGSGSYLPGLTPRMLERLSPSAIILVDAHEAEIRGRRKLDKSRPLRAIESYEDILEHKLINRGYAAAYSARSSCLLRIIQNNTGEFERAVEDFIETVRFIGIEEFTPPGKPRPPGTPLETEGGDGGDDKFKAEASGSRGRSKGD